MHTRTETMLLSLWVGYLGLVAGAAGWSLLSRFWQWRRS